MAENLKLKNKEDAKTLCQVLARESFFGKETMEKCTPGGRKGFSLPCEELFALKQTMFEPFPEYKDCPVGFELLWDQRVKSVERACRRTSHKSK